LDLKFSDSVVSAIHFGKGSNIRLPSRLVVAAIDSMERDFPGD